MFKKTVTYTDYNGVERTEDFYFNLSTAEVMEMELTHPGGYGAMLQRIVNASDTPSVVETFKDLLLASYGEKSPDGKRFVKSPEISAAFSQTEAYSIIFEELFTNTDAVVDFTNGIFPQKLAEKMGEAAAAKDKPVLKLV